jgi:hypothetical protein
LVNDIDESYDNFDIAVDAEKGEFESGGDDSGNSGEEDSAK